MLIQPGDVVFCLLSFEGPDRYSMAGGRGVRVTHLADALADLGFETHLLFIGDPRAAGREERRGGRLTLHRWCQWISAYHGAGVYDGEESKLNDFNDSAPRFIVDEVIRPALLRGKVPVILAEEWPAVYGWSREGRTSFCAVEVGVAAPGILFSVYHASVDQRRLPSALRIAESFRWM